MDNSVVISDEFIDVEAKLSPKDDDETKTSNKF